MNIKLVLTQLDILLAPLGFVRKKSTWNRRSNEFVDVIDVQSSKSGDSITVNAGVLHSRIHRIFSGKEPPSVVEEPLCTVRARIGQLIDKKDFWWPQAAHGTAVDLVEKVKAHILPFLDRMHSMEGMEDYLTQAQVLKQRYPPPIIYLAIVKWLKGNEAEATTILEHLNRNTVIGWQATIKQVITRLSGAGS